MNRTQIEPAAFINRSVHIWGTQWLLLTAGDFQSGEYNTMTVGWGSMGVMWNRPFVQVVVRPTRFTFEFMERFQSFTVSAFPDTYRQALQILGTRSGREGNKIADAGLTPIASHEVQAPGFQEAELIIECEKLYWEDFSPDRFLDASIERQYPAKDYHRVYFGEIKRIAGIPAYQA